MPTILVGPTADFAALVAATDGAMKRREFGALGILADYLDETGHRESARLREMIRRYDGWMHYAATHDFSKSRRWCRNSIIEHAAKWIVRRWDDLRARLRKSMRRVEINDAGEPVPEPPKPSPVVKRAAKAAADLARWERKLKLAKGKVAKYRARVKYYARKNAV